MFSFLTTSRGECVYRAYPSVSFPTGNYQSNNKFEQFPSIMNDGRSVLASWQPGTVVNQIIQKENGIQSNWQYRQYLAKHANEIRAQHFQAACTDTGYFVRDHKTEDIASYQTPQVYGSLQEPIKHRGSGSSDLKELYLTREQLQAKQVVPSLTQAELIKQFPLKRE
jgi:hypothetical protein